MIVPNKREHHLITTFFGLIGIDCLVAVIWLLRIPGDPKNAFLGGFSIQRLAMLSTICILGGLCLFLMVVSWRTRKLSSFVFGISRHPKLPIIFFFSLLVGMVIGLVLLLVPPSAFVNNIAIYERLIPLIRLGALISFQSLLLVSFLSHDVLRDWARNSLKKIRSHTVSEMIGCGLLTLAIVIATTQIFFVYYNLGDEGDKLTGGWLMANGWILYRDIFSHHFPLSYVWVALIVKLLGPSIFIVRLSIILLRALIFLVAMRVSQYKLALGLTAFAWSILGIFYLGNSLVYDSFSAIFLLAGFSISLAIINQSVKPNKKELLIAGSFFGLTVMTDPLGIYPTVLVAIFLFLSAFTSRPFRLGIKIGLVRVGWLVTGIFIVILPFLLGFLITGSLKDFIASGILFNIQIYAKYLPPASANNLLQPIIKILNLLNRQWFNQLDPFLKLDNFLLIDNWIFTGFFYRLSILLCSLIFLLRGKVLAGLLLYLLAASLLIRTNLYFHAAPFVLLSFFASSLLLSIFTDERVSGVQPEESAAATILPKRVFRPIFRLFWLVIFLMFVWLNLRGLSFLIDNSHKLSYKENFGELEWVANHVKELTCSRPDARLLVYPLNPIVYFLAQIPPASKYYFMTPWVAEVGLKETITELDEEPAVIMIYQKASIWGIPVSEYLGELIDFLENNYSRVRPFFYVSPQLNQACPIEP